jgi:hypothetical protein
MSVCFSRLPPLRLGPAFGWAVPDNTLHKEHTRRHPPQRLASLVFGSGGRPFMQFFFLKHVEISTAPAALS